MGSRETPLLKKPPLILLLHILLPSKAPLLRQVSNWFDKTPSSLISRRWQRRRLTLILPTQRWERQPPKFSPASKLEWLENLQKRPKRCRRASKPGRKLFEELMFLLRLGQIFCSFR